jgi:hypothetical protein
MEPTCCPFCSSKAKLTVFKYDTSNLIDYGYTCSNEGCLYNKEKLTYSTKDKALTRWNNRCMNQYNQNFDNGKLSLTRHAKQRLHKRFGIDKIPNDILIPFCKINKNKSIFRMEWLGTARDMFFVIDMAKNKVITVWEHNIVFDVLSRLNIRHEYLRQRNYVRGVSI